MQTYNNVGIWNSYNFPRQNVTKFTLRLETFTTVDKPWRSTRTWPIEIKMDWRGRGRHKKTFSFFDVRQSVHHHTIQINQPTIRNSFTSWHLYVLGRLHYRMTLQTAKSDRDVRTRSTGFRVDFGTRYVTIQGVTGGTDQTSGGCSLC
jgi:hypothetical protein